MKNGVLREMCWLLKTGACSQDSVDKTSQRAQPMNHYVFYLNLKEVLSLSQRTRRPRSQYFYPFHSSACQPPHNFLLSATFFRRNAMEFFNE